MAEKKRTDGSMALQEKQCRVITIAPAEQLQDIKLRVAAYARVSSSSDDQLNSFAAQNRYYATLISGKENWTMVDIYADEGITGTSAKKRKDFQRLNHSSKARESKAAGHSASAPRCCLLPCLHRRGRAAFKLRSAADLLFPMYLVKNCHEPIISHEMFDLVQEERKRRAHVEGDVKAKTVSAPAAVYSSKYALSSILVCGECNTLYQRCVWKKNRKTRVVWRCRNRVSHGTRYCKTSPTIDEAPLHRALVEAINSQICRPEYLLAPFIKSMSEIPADESIPPAKSMEELYSHLRELQRRLDIEFVNLVAECAAHETKQIQLDCFRELIEQRKKRFLH